jgi:serine/threonine-protein kinase
VAVLGVLALLGLVAALRSGGGTAPGASSSGPSVSVRAAAPATVALAVSPLIGQPLDTARARLHQLGLVMRVQWQRSDQEPGTVLAVEPSGQVRAGSTVVVTAAFAGHGQDHGNGNGGGDGGGGGGDGNGGGGGGGD